MEIRLPVMVCMDGFIISHSIERMEYLDDAEVKKFVGEFKNLHPLLDLDKPKSYGPLILTDLFHEYKRAQHEVMTKAKGVVLEVAKEFEKLSGRKYGLFESYRLEDADIALVILNSAAGTSKDVVDEFRDRGIRAGLLKPRLFRPFPYEEVAEALKNTKAVCVMDRADSFGGYGPLFMEVSSALYQLRNRPALVNKIYGLGGRDYLPSHAELVLNELDGIAKGDRAKTVKEYIGVRE
jgi:pyruvate ferredoxin oxidoreductase alpha subunit